MSRSRVFPVLYFSLASGISVHACANTLGSYIFFFATLKASSFSQNFALLTLDIPLHAQQLCIDNNAASHTISC